MPTPGADPQANAGSESDKRDGRNHLDSMSTSTYLLILNREVQIASNIMSQAFPLVRCSVIQPLRRSA